MNSVYPPITPYKTHLIKVTDPHQLYVEECGNPKGLPLVFVHGGPGGGSTVADRCFFDPGVYRIIIFDQRGAGRSVPLAELSHNTTADLVGDIETIRKAMGVDRWVVFGGSWGSTLGLVYAQTYSERVLGLILRGIFLARDEDAQWLYAGGAGSIFPDYWRDFVTYIPEAEQGELLQAYYRRLTHPDVEVQKRAAAAWISWEGRCASLLPNTGNIEMLKDPKFAWSFSRISCHYFLNDCFLKKNQILSNVSRLQSIPGLIVHGRYDILCPVENAYTLHHSWPGSELTIVPGAGHMTSEPGIADALVTATQAMAKRLL